MLVLSRRKNESIMVGEEIEIVITDVRSDRVRLGISAPKHVPVHRKEIYDAIQRKKPCEITELLCLLWYLRHLNS